MWIFNITTLFAINKFQNVKYYFCMHLTLLSLFLYRSKCCAGYIYDNNTSICIRMYTFLDMYNIFFDLKLSLYNHPSMFLLCIVACRTGFIGKYCERECPYPSFGDRCQLRCVCEQKHCDIVRGCITLLGRVM